MSADRGNFEKPSSEDQLNRAFESDPRLRKIREYVEAHLDEPFKLEDVAQVVPLERKYFSAFFKTATGETFSRWLQRIRIEKAKQMLEDRDYRVHRIANQVGYTHLRTFQRAFKRETGMSASQYRKQSR